MLKRAKAAMTAGRAGAALRELDAHARRFPGSSLADLRDAMRVSALCDAGERDEARTAASRFEGEHPRSRFAERVRSTCRGDGS
jgi:outer membrane protein assembly factor BamD (BamD/ComL family)